MDILAIVGENCRRLRRDSGLSQEKAAYDSEIDRTYLSGIENGKRNPSITVIAELADTYGVEPYELLMPPKAKREIGSPRNGKIFQTGARAAGR